MGLGNTVYAEIGAKRAGNVPPDYGRPPEPGAKFHPDESGPVAKDIVGMTIQQFERLADDDTRMELVRGSLVREPPAGGEHGTLAGALIIAIGTFVRRHGLGVVCGSETGFILAVDPPTVRAPDVAFVARARCPAEGVPRGYWPIAPDLAVEVVSPSNTAQQLLDKVGDYLQAGTRLVWLVYPRTRSAIVHRSEKAAVLIEESEFLDGGDVLPGLRLLLSDIFAATR
jgi:Uma2 family endonuclease